MTFKSTPYRTYAKKQPTALQELARELFGPKSQVVRVKFCESRWCFMLTTSDYWSGPRFYVDEDSLKETLLYCAKPSTLEMHTFSNGKFGLISKAEILYSLGVFDNATS